MQRIELGNDVVAGFAADKNAAHRAAGTDAVFRIATLDLVRRCVGQIRPVPFARVNDQHVDEARGREYVPARRNGGLQSRHVIAERGAETAGLEEVALHINDDQRRPLKLDGQRCRLGFKGHARHPDLLPRTEWKSARSGPAKFGRQRGGKATATA